MNDIIAVNNHVSVKSIRSRAIFKKVVLGVNQINKITKSKVEGDVASTLRCFTLLQLT